MMRERLLLFVRFVLILAFGGLIGLMLARAWVPGTPAHDAVYGSAFLFDVGRGTPIEMLTSFGIGVYLGLLTLFTLDWRKRFQGLLLYLGTAIGLVVLWESGLLLANLSLTDPMNWVAFFGGVVVVIALEFSALRRQIDDISRAEFDTVVLATFVGFAGLAVGGLAQALVTEEVAYIVDVPVTGAFVYVLFGFIAYDSTSKTAIVGPQESGKTMTIVGLYQRFSRQSDIPTESTDALDDHITEIDRMASGDDFILRATRGIRRIEFYFQVGDIFPMRSRFTTHDHPGEKIEDIAAALREGPSPGDRLRLFYLWLRRGVPGLSPPGTPSYQDLAFYHHVRTADVIVVLLDMDRIRNDQQAYISELNTIAEGTKSSCRVLPVATKCDLVLEDYLGVYGDQLEPGFGDEYLHSPDPETGQTPAQRLTDRLVNERLHVDTLMNSVDSDIIYPIYFKTVQDEQGTYLPDLDEAGNLQPVGFEQLMDELEHEAMRDVTV